MQNVIESGLLMLPINKRITVGLVYEKKDP